MLIRKPKKRKPVNEYLMTNSVSDILAYYKSFNTTFKVALTKSTTTVEFKNLKERFMTNQMSIMVFVAYNKIVKDVNLEKNEDLLLDMKCSVIEANNNYYGVGLFKPFTVDKLYCVDINSAYLQSLFNLGLIEPITFNFCQSKLKKLDRLKAVGMLARQKHIYTYEKGKLADIDTKTCEYRFIFNAIIQMVNEVMRIAESVCTDYIFYWVDGIYTHNFKDVQRICDVFKQNNFEYKVKELRNFVNSPKYSHLSYCFEELESDGEYHPKKFNIPNFKTMSEINRNSKEVLETN